MRIGDVIIKQSESLTSLTNGIFPEPLSPINKRAKSCKDTKAARLYYALPWEKAAYSCAFF